MSLLALETKWKTVLTSILEELTPYQVRKLLFKLEKIPQGLRTERHREELPDLIIQHYGTERSISVIDKEMKVFPRNDAKVQEPLQSIVVKMKELKKRQEAKETAKQPATASGSGKKTKPATGTTSKPASASGSVKTPKPAAGQPKSCQTYMMDPVGAKKPKQKKKQKESLNLSSPSLKAAQHTKTSKVPSTAVQTWRIKITGIKSSNKRNTHLEVEFNGRQRKFYVTTRLLADAFGIKAEKDFREIFFYLMPINAEAQIQGKKIIGIQNHTYL